MEIKQSKESLELLIAVIIIIVMLGSLPSRTVTIVRKKNQDLPVTCY